MKTDSIEVGRVLQDNCRFIVPIYQRQHAWNDSRIQPFWDDVVAKAEELQVGHPQTCNNVSLHLVQNIGQINLPRPPLRQLIAISIYYDA